MLDLLEAFVDRLLVWSRVLVTGSALACVLMGIGVGTVNAPSAQPTVREYVEVLDEDPSPYGEMDDEEVNL